LAAAIRQNSVRRPALGSPVPFNSVSFEVVGKKISHGNTNDQNLRLVMPYTTMATYFPRKAEGSANAIQYVSYQTLPRKLRDPFCRRLTNERRWC